MNSLNEGIKVGDKVIIHSGGFYAKVKRVGEVVKVTPSGLVDVLPEGQTKTSRFNKRMRLYGASNSYNSTYITRATDEDLKALLELNARNTLKEYIQAFNLDLLSTIELGEICKILKYRDKVED